MKLDRTQRLTMHAALTALEAGTWNASTLTTIGELRDKLDRETATEERSRLRRETAAAAQG